VLCTIRGKDDEALPDQGKKNEMSAQQENFCSNCQKEIEKDQDFCPQCSFPQKLIAGKYRLEHVLSEGGFGVVYAARHIGLQHNPRRAIKLLKSHQQKKPESLSRFEQEVQVTAVLSEKNNHIVRIFDDFGHEENLGYYFVMEYLQGQDLSLWIKKNKPPKREEVFHIAEQLCRALHAAHQQGIIHRDLKPDNVFLIQHESDPLYVKLLDFGIARSIQDSTKRTVGALGTPEYMSPEQCLGEQVTHRCDIYALGVMLYEMFTGYLPFDMPKKRSEEDVVSLLRAHVWQTPRPLPQHPSAPFDNGFEQVLFRALAKDPQQRYDSMKAFWEALSPYATKPKPAPKTATTTNEHLFAVEIAPSSYWVGSRPSKSIFFANPYLRIFRGRNKNGQKIQFNLLIDPGSSQDFATVQAKVSSLIGGMDKISAVFINHQDPDVASSTTLLLGRYAPRANIICSEDTWRLVQHYNLPRERFLSTDKYPRGFAIETGHTLVPVPSPFCHFAGAVMLYDPETRVLYTGDLFGGLTAREAVGLYADDSDWTGMRAFHQLYMPMNKALVRVMQRIRQLSPAPQMIAPQHGRVIRESLIDFFMRHLENLPVGLDLVEDAGETNDAWNTVFRRVLNVAEQVYGSDVRPILRRADELAGALDWPEDQPSILYNGRWVVERSVILLTTGLPSWVADPIKMEAILAAEELRLASPNPDAPEGGV